jgi:hypothetical protein
MDMASPVWVRPVTLRLPVRKQVVGERCAFEVDLGFSR